SPSTQKGSVPMSGPKGSVPMSGPSPWREPASPVAPARVSYPGNEGRTLVSPERQVPKLGLTESPYRLLVICQFGLVVALKRHLSAGRRPIVAGGCGPPRRHAELDPVWCLVALRFFPRSQVSGCGVAPGLFLRTNLPKSQKGPCRRPLQHFRGKIT